MQFFSRDLILHLLEHRRIDLSTLMLSEGDPDADEDEDDVIVNVPDEVEEEEEEVEGSVEEEIIAKAKEKYRGKTVVRTTYFGRSGQEIYTKLRSNLLHLVLLCI